MEDKWDSMTIEELEELCESEKSIASACRQSAEQEEECAISCEKQAEAISKYIEHRINNENTN